MQNLQSTQFILKKKLCKVHNKYTNLKNTIVIDQETDTHNFTPSSTRQTKKTCPILIINW